MELHTCNNCLFIDEIIEKQVYKFGALTEENVTLHNLLIKARTAIAELSSEVLNLHDVLVAERQHNLQLHLQKHLCDQGVGVTTIAVNPESKEYARVRGLDAKTSYKSLSSMAEDGKDYVYLSKYNDLKNLLEEQKRVFEESLGMLQAANNNCALKLKEQLREAHNHSISMLEMCAKYRCELFKQRKVNIEERKQFVEAVNALKKANADHIQETESKMMATAMNIAKKQTRDVLNSVHQQVDLREKLVVALRCQQKDLEMHIEKLEKKNVKQRQQQKRVISELTERWKAVQQKYAALELRRKLDAEGFCTDINNIRKEIGRYKNITAVKRLQNQECCLDSQTLLKEVNKISEKLSVCFCN